MKRTPPPFSPPTVARSGQNWRAIRALKTTKQSSILELHINQPAATMQLNELGEKLKLIACNHRPRGGPAMAAACSHRPRGGPEVTAAVSSSFTAKFDPISKILFLDLWQDDRAVVRKALKQLANLCFHGENRERNRRTVFAVGGFSMLVNVMRQWSDCSEIQAEGCRSILNLCLDCGATLCVSASAKGALEAVLTAMQRFADDAYLQRVGCGALYALTKNNAANAHRLVLELHGAFRVVRAMRDFPHSKRLQMWATAAVAEWAQWETLRQSILDAGALGAIDLAMASFRDEDKAEDMAIQEKARSALGNLAPRSPATTITLVVNKRQFLPKKQVRFLIQDE